MSRSIMSRTRLLLIFYIWTISYRYRSENIGMESIFRFHFHDQLNLTQQRMSLSHDNSDIEFYQGSFGE